MANCPALGGAVNYCGVFVRLRYDRDDCADIITGCTRQAGYVRGNVGLLANVQQEKKWQHMSEKTQNLQDVFLNNIRKSKTSVTVFLVNGVKLQGVITWFDNFCVLLRRDGHSQLVYKHAISTIMPSGPIQLFDPEKDNSHN